MFYTYKRNDRPLEITVELSTVEENVEYKFFSSEAKYSHADLPELRESTVANQDIDLLSTFKLLYSIERDHPSPFRVTAICSDGRTIPVSILSRSALPGDTQAIFILMSDYFDGRTNSSRESLMLDEVTTSRLKVVFQDKIADIIREELPVPKLSDSIRFHQSEYSFR